MNDVRLEWNRKVTAMAGQYSDMPRWCKRNVPVLWGFSRTLLLPTTMDTSKCIPANPDISGIGVRTAIYAQNLLCFVPVIFYLWDGKISVDELAGIQDQSTGMLTIAFAILITTVSLAAGRNPTVSNYHAAIILNLSWMNNTSTWIWVILYVHQRSRATYKHVAATWPAQVE